MVVSAGFSDYPKRRFLSREGSSKVFGSRQTAIGCALWGALLSTAAQAGPVALHPLVVIDGSEQDQQDFHALLTVALVKQNIALVEAEKVREFLEKQPGHSCVGRDECLAELAKATEASRALVV